MKLALRLKRKSNARAGVSGRSPGAFENDGISHKLRVLDGGHGYLMYRDIGSKQKYYRDLRRRRRTLRVIEDRFPVILGGYRSYKGSNTLHIVGTLLKLLKIAEPSLLQDHETDPRIFLDKLRSNSIVQDDASPKVLSDDEKASLTETVNVMLQMLLLKCDEIDHLQKEVEFLQNEKCDLGVQLFEAYSNIENLIKCSVFDDDHEQVNQTFYYWRMMELNNLNQTLYEENKRLRIEYLNTLDQLCNVEYAFALQDVDPDSQHLVEFQMSLTTNATASLSILRGGRFSMLGNQFAALTGIGRDDVNARSPSASMDAEMTASLVSREQELQRQRQELEEQQKQLEQMQKDAEAKKIEIEKREKEHESGRQALSKQIRDFEQYRMQQEIQHKERQGKLKQREQDLQRQQEQLKQRQQALKSKEASSPDNKLKGEVPEHTDGDKADAQDVAYKLLQQEKEDLQCQLEQYKLEVRVQQDQLELKVQEHKQQEQQLQAEFEERKKELEQETQKLQQYKLALEVEQQELKQQVEKLEQYKLQLEQEQQQQLETGKQVLDQHQAEVETTLEQREVQLKLQHTQLQEKLDKQAEQLQQQLNQRRQDLEQQEQQLQSEFEERKKELEQETQKLQQYKLALEVEQQELKQQVEKLEQYKLQLEQQQQQLQQRGDSVQLQEIMALQVTIEEPEEAVFEEHLIESLETSPTDDSRRAYFDGISLFEDGVQIIRDDSPRQNILGESVSSVRDFLCDAPAPSLEQEKLASCYVSLEKVLHSLVDGVKASDELYVNPKLPIVVERLQALENENKLLHDYVHKLQHQISLETQEKVTLNSQLAQLKGEILHSKQALGKLQTQSEVILKCTAEISSLRASNNAYSQQLQKLQTQASSLNDEKRRMETQMTHFKTRLVTATKECDVLKSEIFKIQAIVGDGTNLSTKESVEQQIANIHLRGHVTLLKEESDRVGKEVEVLRKSNMDLAANLLKLQNELQREKHVNAEYINQINVKAELEAKLRAQIDRCVFSMEALQKENVSIGKLLVQARDESTSLSQKIYDQQLEISKISTSLENVSSGYRELLTSIANLTPVKISLDTTTGLDLNIKGFDPAIYGSIFQSIQDSCVDPNINISDIMEQARQLKLVSNKLIGVFQYNYIVTNLTMSLCKELHRLSEVVLKQSPPDAQLILDIKANADYDALQMERFGTINRLNAKIQELETLVSKASAISIADRLERLHQSELDRAKEQYASIETLLREKERVIESLGKQNEKLLEDCTGAAKAIGEFEQRLNEALGEKAAFSERIFTMVPDAHKSTCSRDDWASALEIITRLIIQLQQDIKNANERMDEAKVQHEKQLQEQQAFAQQQTPARPHEPLLHPSPAAPTSTNQPIAISVIEELISNFSYYCKAIKENIRDQIRDYSDTSLTTDCETDFEGSGGLNYDTDDDDKGADAATEVNDYDFDFNGNGLAGARDATAVNRKLVNYFEAILELLDQLRDAHHNYVLLTSKFKSSGPSIFRSDFALMQHFSQLCAVLREAVAGTPQQFRLDDLLYQLESLPASSDNAEKRKYQWDKCIGNIVSLVTGVLQHGYREHHGALNQAYMQVQSLQSSLEEAKALQRVQFLELKQRANHISQLQGQLDAMSKYSRKFDALQSNAKNIAKLEQENHEKDLKIQRLVSESNKLQNVIRECEHVNNQLYDQLSHSTFKINELNSALKSRNRQVLTLQDEIIKLDTPANLILLVTINKLAMKFNTLKRFLTTSTASSSVSSSNVVGDHVRVALENLKHDGQLSTLISALNSDTSHLLDLGFSEIQLIANQYRKLYKSQQIPHDVNEKMASLMLDYFTRHASAGLKVPQCLELFDVSCQTRLDKQTGLLAWHIYSVAKDKCVDVPPREWLELVMNVLKRLTRYNILYPEMLDFVSQHLVHLDKDLLVDFAKIAQRNGLRSKHHLDAACKASLQLVSQYDFATLIRLLGCFCYFSHEYKDLFVAARPMLLENVSKMSQDDVLMVLNICKTLHKEPDFLQLRDAILQELINNFETCTLQFLVATLPHLTRGTRTFVGGQYISKVLDICETEFEECNVQKLASIMACIEFWNIRMSHLTSILDVLASKIKQVAYNRNLGLWSEIFNVIYSTGWFHVEFMKAASTNIIMEPQVLHRVSTHQIVRVLQAYYKIRYFHKGAYQAMLDAIDGDFNSIANRPNVVAEALLAAADAHMPCESLAQKSLDVLTKVAQVEAGQDKDVVSVLEASNFWPRNIITSAWALTVYDLHKDPKFVPLLKLLGLDAVANVDTHQPSLVLMALEVAEACIIDGIEVDFCRELMDVYGAIMRRQQQALDNIDKQRQQQLLYGSDVEQVNVDASSVEKASYSCNQNSHFHKGRMRATRHIYDILSAMRRRDVLLRVAPHYNSPFVIDICFSSEDRRGIVLFSGRELLRNHLDGKWSIVETGSTHLKRKILSSSGWTLFEISCAEWAKLTNTNERRQYIKDALARLGM